MPYDSQYFSLRHKHQISLVWHVLVSFQAPCSDEGKGLITLERYLILLVARSVWLYHASKLRNRIHNNCFRATFWFSLRKAKQLTMHDITSQHDVISHKNNIIKIQSDWLMRKQDCWACKDTLGYDYYFVCTESCSTAVYMRRVQYNQWSNIIL